MMPAGGGNLERPLGAFLALDVAQVELIAWCFMDPRCRARQYLRALEMIGDLDQGVCRDNLDVRARPGRLASAGRRTNEPLVARIGTDGGRQDARDRRDRAVEAEFAEHGEARKRIGGYGADCRHQAERDRQIIMAAFLWQVGGREIDRDSPCGQREPRGDQRRTHPLAGFRDRLVGKANDMECWQAGRDLHLHVDRASLDPLKSYGGNPLDHAAPLPRWKVAEGRRQGGLYT